MARTPPSRRCRRRWPRATRRSPPANRQRMGDAAQRVMDAEHVTIYYDRRQFAAWPFNHGFWAFPGAGSSGPELLAGFSRGPCRYESPEQLRHQVVDAGGGEYVVLRSTDGGRTWPVEGLQSLGSRREIERQLLEGDAPPAPSQPVDFTSPDFCLTAGFGIPPAEAKHVGYVQ